MTHISSFKTKKHFKAAIAEDPDRVFVDDPSMFNPISGSVLSVSRQMRSFTVTNHPKRSWFARVHTKELDNGEFEIKVD